MEKAGVSLVSESLDTGVPGEPILLCPASRELLDDGLEDALTMLNADRGNIQLVDPDSGSLRIVAQIGFNDDFLKYFAIVDDEASACGRAARQLAQTVITDVNTDVGFAPHRQIAASSNFRAVQSTPLVDTSGQLVGMLSAHHRRPHRPSDRDLQYIRRFGVLIGHALEASEEEGRQPAARSTAA